MVKLMTHKLHWQHMYTYAYVWCTLTQAVLELSWQQYRCTGCHTVAQTSPTSPGHSDADMRPDASLHLSGQEEPLRKVWCLQQQQLPPKPKRGHAVLSSVLAEGRGRRGGGLDFWGGGCVTRGGGVGGRTF